MDELISTLLVRQLGRQPYTPVWQAMQTFTEQRTPETQDELWLVEHEPVFTQGLAGRPEHLLTPGDIPVVQVDRGGQVTYHGPGQQVIYFLLDLKRLKLGVRQLVEMIEKAVIELLEKYQIPGELKEGEPGVYVEGRKICSIGLRVRRGACFHGMALNVAMDKQPFERINPCGYAGLAITQISELAGPSELEVVAMDILEILKRQLGYKDKRIVEKPWLPDPKNQTLRD